MFVIIRKADQAFLDLDMYKYTKQLEKAHHFGTREEAAREITSFEKEAVIHIEDVSKDAVGDRAKYDKVIGIISREVK